MDRSLALVGLVVALGGCRLLLDSDDGGGSGASGGSGGSGASGGSGGSGASGGSGGSGAQSDGGNAGSSSSSQGGNGGSPSGGGGQGGGEGGSGGDPLCTDAAPCALTQGQHAADCDNGSIVQAGSRIVIQPQKCTGWFDGSRAPAPVLGVPVGTLNFAAITQVNITVGPAGPSPYSVAGLRFQPSTVTGPLEWPWVKWELGFIQPAGGGPSYDLLMVHRVSEVPPGPLALICRDTAGGCVGQLEGTAILGACRVVGEIRMFYLEKGQFVQATNTEGTPVSAYGLADPLTVGVTAGDWDCGGGTGAVQGTFDYLAIDTNIQNFSQCIGALDALLSSRPVQECTP